MFSLLIAMRPAVAMQPASSPNHGAGGQFQGVSARKTAARVIDFLAASALTLLLITSSGQAGPQYLAALNGLRCRRLLHASRSAPGRNEYAFFWNGATWLFSSEANREAFAANPENFAPRYDGYCWYAASQGYKAPGSPLAWHVVDGKTLCQLQPTSPGAVVGRRCRPYRRWRQQLAETQRQLR